MLEYERQLREKLTNVLPSKKPIPPGGKEPTKGLGVARRAFIDGYQNALKAKKEDIPSLFEGASPNAVGFMFEGAGMAYTMLDEMNNSEEKYLPILFSGRPESELKLCAIGVGWASARLSKPAKWKPEGISDQWIPSIINGYGFHVGFFNQEGYNSTPFFEVEEEQRENFDIGLGRALWFTHEGEVEPIAKVILSLEPSRQDYIWTGIGIACVFNSDDEKKSILKKLSSPNESYLIRGFEKAANLKQELHTAF
ncbi:MAG: DUF1702 family protein [Flavobacteriaceae bacterium]